MPPHSDETVKSTIGIKNPTKDSKNGSPGAWLLDKKAVDGAEGLWRIHNGLYDFSDFVKNHPGGQFWLEVTKDTDITEAFECHHISTIAETMLKKFHIRDTNTPRNAPFTFKEDGFYRTLKRAVREELKNIPPNVSSSNIIIDSLLAGTFIFAILANIFWSYILAIIAGLLSGFVVLSAHNYTHQRDNFRMYYMDLFMSQSRGFRIVHILSHHLYTNTVADIQAYITEPLLVYFPQKKSWIVKYASAVYMPILLWTPLFFIISSAGVIKKIMGHKYSQPWAKVDLLPILLPLVMYFSSSQSLLSTILMWQVIVAIGSLFFSIIAMTMGHFHPDIFMDGDTPRPKDQLDWGILQLDAVGDRYEITGNQFVKLIAFGDHALHHLFPTLDGGVLEYLYPVTEKIMKQYNLNIRMMPQVSMFKGYLRRVAKEVPNPNPPDLHKKLE